MTAVRSRFSSSASTPVAAPDPAPVAPTLSATDLAQRKADLTAKAQQLNQNRLRYEAIYEQGERELRTIQREAEALGVHTLEEFLALIATTEAKDAEELARYETELAAEAALQDEVERKLQAMDSGA